MPIIKLEKEKCISCGTCWSICDRFFEAGEDNKSSLRGGVQEIEVEETGCAQNAAEACPVQCIKIV